MGGQKGHLTSGDLNSWVDKEHAVLGLHTNTVQPKLAAEFLHETAPKTYSVFYFRAKFQRNQYQYQRGEIALLSLTASDTAGALQTCLVSASHPTGYGIGGKYL